MGWVGGRHLLDTAACRESVSDASPGNMLLGTHGQGWVVSQVIEQVGTQPNLCAPTSFKLYRRID